MKNRRVGAIEEFLKLKPGSFGHIPHYALPGAIEAISHVMRTQQQQLYRPGLYYIVLSDLSRATVASGKLGPELNRLRIESFIVKCIEALGQSHPENYAMFVREIGDAVLIMFSSFKDVLNWHLVMRDFLRMQNVLWKGPAPGCSATHN